MKNIICFICIFLSYTVSGQAPVFESVIQQGGNYYDVGQHIANDPQGNTYVSGEYSNTADFDPGPEEYTLTANSTVSIFTTKLNEKGQFVWAVSIDLNYNNYVRDMVVDTLGNVYLIGSYSGTVDFDPGDNVYNLSTYGGQDVFILKLDKNGSFVWARNMGGINYDYGYSIAVDNIGNIYSTGTYLESAIFSTNPIVSLTSNSNVYNVFISKYDSDGQLVWLKNISGESQTNASSIKIDHNNNPYIMGHFQDTIDFDPGPEEHLLVGIGTRKNIFILKLNSDGDFTWAKNIGNTTNTSTPIKGENLEIDNNDNIYLSGFFRGPTDFDPGLDTSLLIPSNNSWNTPFLLKLDHQGGYLWSKAFERLFMQDIALDSDDNIYRVGSFSSTIDFDPGPNTFYLTTTGSTNPYIQKLDSNGDFIWAGSFTGQSGNQYLYSISIDALDNVYTTGGFRYNMDFAPDSNTYQLSSNGSNYDVFIQKMRNQTCPAGPTINSNQQDFSVCQGDTINLMAQVPFGITDVSYSWDSGQELDSILVAPDTTTSYTAHISYNIDTTICQGSETVEVSVLDRINLSVTHGFEICANTEVTIGASGGEFYIWSTGDSSNLTTISPAESQHYLVTATNAFGCQATDSVSVIVNPTSDTTFLDFISCDSISLNPIEIVFLNQHGCDSVVIENSIFLPLPENPAAPSDLVIQQNAPPFEISSPGVPKAVSYQWTVPPSVQILSGENTNSIIVDWGDLTTGGTVCISAINECGESEQDCMEITVEMVNATTGMATKDFAVFPNPNSGLFQIVFPTFTEGSYELRDLSGKLIAAGILGQESKLDISKRSQGMYLLLVKTKSGVWTERIVKM